MERAMAHIEKIIDIQPIENADAIEVATILGWKCVVKKGDFNIGDRVVYVEVDSWVPYTVAPFLLKNKERVYNGVPGDRIRTIKLRGQLSQGLVLKCMDDWDFEVGTDVSPMLNIQKWEPPIPVEMRGKMRGYLPSIIKKTDQERIQNIYYDLREAVETGKIVDEWIVQEKLEGSSMQVAIIDGDIHVMSRNVDLKLEGNDDNLFIKTANSLGLVDLMSRIETNYACLSIQGELIGPGIQNNIYRLNEYEWRLFDIWNGERFLSIPEINDFIKAAKNYGVEIKAVPMERGVIKDLFKNSTCDDILAMAEINTSLCGNQLAEGLVFKNAHNPNVTFKAISNQYLIEQGKNG